MKKKHLSCVLALGLAAMMTLSSCGTATTGSATSGKSKYSGVTLNYAAMWNETESQAQVAKAAIDDFEKAYPGVKVNVTWGGRDIRKTLKTSLDANQQIDIIENSPDWLSTNLDTTYLLNLDKYYDKTYSTTNGKKFKDTLLPAMVKFASTYNNDGHLYYVPNQPSIGAVFYNKDLFKKAGITDTPKTWDDFTADCEKLKAAGITPMTIDDAYYGLPIGQYLALAKGDKWVEKLVTDKTGSLWSDPAVMQMAKAFEDLYKKGYISKTAGSNKFPAGQQEVALGKVAMYMMNGSWFPNEVKSTTGGNFNWGAFAYPDVPNATEKNTSLMLISQGYAINKKSKNPDAAFELISFFMSKKTQQQFVEKSACVPTTVDTDWPKELQDCKPMFEKMDKTFIWDGGLDAGGDFSPNVTAEYGKLLSGQISAEQYVKDIQTKAKR